MSQPSRDELIKRLADLEADREAVTMALVVTELDERLYRGLGESEQVAADRLHAAFEALKEPLEQLAAIDGKIAAAQERCSGLRAELAALEANEDDQDAPDKMAVVKMHLAEWEAQVTRLRSKRDFADSGFQPLYEDRDRCKKNLAVIKGAQERVLEAMLDPFGDPVAQETEAYTSFRMPQLVPVLLRNDRESREWDRAVAELEELCLRSAYRTDDLPSNAEQAARAMTSAMADATGVLAPVPNASEVMLADTIKLVNETMPASKIEDHRNSAPMPRNLPERPWMQVPR